VGIIRQVEIVRCGLVDLPDDGAVKGDVMGVGVYQV